MGVSLLWDRMRSGIKFCIEEYGQIRLLFCVVCRIFGCYRRRQVVHRFCVCAHWTNPQWTGPNRGLFQWADGFDFRQRCRQHGGDRFIYHPVSVFQIVFWRKSRPNTPLCPGKLFRPALTRTRPPISIPTLKRDLESVMLLCRKNLSTRS